MTQKLPRATRRNKRAETSPLLKGHNAKEEEEKQEVQEEEQVEGRKRR